MLFTVAVKLAMSSKRNLCSVNLNNEAACKLCTM